MYGTATTKLEAASEKKAVVIAIATAIKNVARMKAHNRNPHRSSSFQEHEGPGSRSDRGGHVTYNLTGP